jgi:hypothetical protein
MQNLDLKKKYKVKQGHDVKGGTIRGEREGGKENMMGKYD